LKQDDKSKSLAAEAYLIVRQRILRGELRIGEAVSRRRIAAELGMSFLPVSEALVRLEIEGLLESRPRAGTRVRIPTGADVRGHYAVREALEVQSARLFASTAAPEEKGELARLAVRVDTLGQTPGGDRAVYLTLHERLHRSIAECARCPALCDAIERTHALASTWLCVGQASPTDGKPRRHHQQLMKALSAGDPALAAEAMRDHIVTSMERALARLEPYFEIGRQNGSKYTRTRKDRVQAVEAVA